MICGLIPVGGNGTRLSLPFSKEMLPQKNFDFFNPIISHVVEKMEMAGADQIVFVHGQSFKRDICDFFRDESKYKHIEQKTTGFGNILMDFYLSARPPLNSKILFGLPDTVFDKNPFVEMLLYSGIVCGLFITDPHSKVDRLNVNKTQFQVKTPKTHDNLDWMWGVLKFDGSDIASIVKTINMEQRIEMGDILNSYPLKHVYGKNYLDIGTWANYNQYLCHDYSFSSNEIEKKYDAQEIAVEQFVSLGLGEYSKITSTDYYFTNNNPNVEFIRYREGSEDKGAASDITIKNFNRSQLNRFELTLPLNIKPENTHDVLHFLNLMETKFEFLVTKECHIFTLDYCVVVFYLFTIGNKEFKIIEIEIRRSRFNLIAEMEQSLSSLSGFDPTKTINQSKFQIIKNHLEVA